MGARPLEGRVGRRGGGAGGGARRQLGERLGLGGDEDVARVLAWEHRRDHKSRRQDRRHVFGGMHRQIDGARAERLLDLLGEETLAAGLRQRPVADHVAGGADDLELDALRGKRMRGGQAIAHLSGLREPERAAACADDERRGSGRGRRRGLHPMTSQCYAGRSRPRQRSPDGAAAKSGLGAGIGSWMVVLGIETTCDETAAAVVERPGEGRGRILSNIVLSQIDEHDAFGGGVPGIAAAAHPHALHLIHAQAMAEAGPPFAPPRPPPAPPRPGRQPADFSLSGLKTALRLEAEKIAPLSEGDVRALCASFQQSVVEVVADRLRAGLKMSRERYGKPNALVAAGGVAANQAIRKVLHQVAFETGTVLVVPHAALCTDNGAMIAWAGAERLALGLTDTLDAAPHARWPLQEVAGPVQEPVAETAAAPEADASRPAAFEDR